MKTLMTLLFLCHVASSVKYNADIDQFLSFGFPKVQDFMVSGIVQEVTSFYYDDAMTTAKVTHDWMRELIKNYTKEWDTIIQECIDSKHVFQAETKSFNNGSDGGHMVQQIMSCEWDDETNDVNGYIRYGNNGEDFIAFDMKTETWTASTERAETVKVEWDKNKVRNELRKNFLRRDCVLMLQLSLSFGKRFVTRKDLPSVSLLQKTPSSPVTCHATGFYPGRAEMFWSKDGEEIHEGVNHGNILPNHDESFQMSVDLDVSSIPSEEWTKYDCVFQLSGVQNVMMTKLDKDVIQSNDRKAAGSLSEISIAVIVVMAVLIVVIVTALGLMTVKKRNERPDTPSSDTISL